MNTQETALSLMPKNANQSTLIGLKLSNRFVIQSKVSEGQFGQVHFAVDTKKENRSVVVKISKD